MLFHDGCGGCLQLFSGIMLYIFNGSKVPLYSASSETASSLTSSHHHIASPLPHRCMQNLVDKDWYFVVRACRRHHGLACVQVFNLFTLAGDALSRPLAYHLKNPPHPFWFLILTVVGMGICLSKIAIIGPIGIFLIFFANGSIYAASTRYRHHRRCIR